MKRYILLVLFIGYSFIGFSQTSNDPDAEAFIAACNTDPSGVKLTEDQMTYITQMVEGLKSIGVWNKMVAVYPIVGGNAYKHKYNLKDPRDLNDAFRLTFINSPTHNSNGVSTNGSNQYIETNFNASNLVTRDNHLSIYLKSVNASTSHHIMGASNSSIPTSLILLISRTGVSTFLSSSSFNFQTFNTTQPNLTGYLIGNSNATNIFLYKNGVEITGSTVAGSSTVFPNLTLVVGASRNTTSGVVNHSAITTPLITIGFGLTDTEAIRLSHLIYYLQGVLQRQ